MRKLLFILAFLPSLAFSGGPKSTFPQPRGLDAEINNIYHDIQAPHSNIYFAAYTLAQLKTMSPTQTGVPFVCTNCVTSAVCISTGTTVFGFSDISGIANACK